MCQDCRWRRWSLRIEPECCSILCNTALSFPAEAYKVNLSLQFFHLLVLPILYMLHVSSIPSLKGRNFVDYLRDWCAFLTEPCSIQLVTFHVILAYLRTVSVAQAMSLVMVWWLMDDGFEAPFARKWQWHNLSCSPDVRLESLSRFQDLRIVGVPVAIRI